MSSSKSTSGTPLSSLLTCTSFWSFQPPTVRGLRTMLRPNCHTTLLTLSIIISQWHWIQPAAQQSFQIATMLGKKKLVISVTNPVRCPGKKLTKTKAIQSKIFKNLSQLPIDLLPGGKQNHMHPNRPTSSFIVQPQAARVHSALGQYEATVNKKRLSLDSTKKGERDSLMSKHSISKKTSKNTMAIDEATRTRLIEDRKKYNNSCCSAIQNASRGEPRRKKTKKNSVSQLHALKKERGPKIKEERIVVGREKQRDKSRSKSRGKVKKSKSGLEPGKTTNSMLALTQDRTGFPKKRQSTSAVAIQPTQKDKKKVRKHKHKESKLEEYSVEEYPINKYTNENLRDVADLNVDKIFIKPSRKRTSKSKSRKSRSKSRKGSLGKDTRQTSILQLDYASCINLASNSSGLIPSQPVSSEGTSQIKIIDNWEYRELGDTNPPSVDLAQMRYYESQPSHQKRQQAFMEKNFRQRLHYRKRREIEKQIVENYPNFSDLELKFLASVVFIQRKWREHRLYRQIFSHYTSVFHPEDPSFLEQSNSKTLNISNSKPNNRSPTVNRKKLEWSLEKEASQDRSSEREDRRMKEQSPIGRRSESEQERQEGNSSEKEVKSARYQHLQTDLFPSITYILLKQHELKQHYLKQLIQLKALHSNDAILYSEYLKMKQKYQEKFHDEMKHLSHSKKDIKKGYLKFIDSVRGIHHEGLRRVSSESGFMANMYQKIFQFDQHSDSPSESSESMRQLSKRLLIRKELSSGKGAHRLALSDSLSGGLKSPQDLSARFFKSRREQGHRKEMHLDIDSISNKRLKRERKMEGVVQSPELSPQPAARVEKLSLEAGSPKLVPLSMSPYHPTPLQQQDKERKYLRQEKLILDEIIALMTHQLFVELIQIDEQREYLVDVMHSERTRVIDIKQSQIIAFAESPLREDESEEEKLRQIYKIEGLAERKQPLSSKQRPSNMIHISPAASESNFLDPAGIISYAQQLVKYLINEKYLPQISERLNKNQGFKPLEYLKFLRDFEIPDDQYEPIISNEVFIAWEEEFLAEGGGEQSTVLEKQSYTIYHRAIFECIICFLEERRPCGEKGLPFPWEKVQFFYRPVREEELAEVLEGCVGRLRTILGLSCGVIEERMVLGSEEELERMHEQNEDRIISMLEGELGASPHAWYEVQEHCLELKMEVEGEVVEYLMLEALDQLLEIHTHFDE